MNKTAVIQLNSSSTMGTNLDRVNHFLSLAQEQAIDLVVLPENFAYMDCSDEQKRHYAESIGDGFLQNTLCKWAKQYNLWIIAGTMMLKTSANKLKASCLVYDNQGKQVARYDKIHLFDVMLDSQEVYKESVLIERGNNLILVETPIGRIGLSVCYDVRFPELYAHLRAKGAEIFSIPSAFTAQTGQAHWEVLIRARAIENLCYALAPNQGGTHEKGRQTYGHSLIVNPWGTILAKCNEIEGMITASIDPTSQQQLRQEFPCNNHHVLGV